MRESFLHFLWRCRRFDTRNLRTTLGKTIEIQKVGEYNTHSGPDFFDARIRIDNTLWAGNIEMHLRASEWMEHRHNEDPAYENVVLHVVFEEDFPIHRLNGERIPCLELKDRIPLHLLEHYIQLENEASWIPCEQFIHLSPDIVRLSWYDRLLVERLEQKTQVIFNTFQATGEHWEETFYRLLARNFGLKINVEPFDALARSLPLLILSRHRSSLLQMEALIFGQAGLLNADFSEEWPRTLAREYRHLAHKYSLDPLQKSQWKFLRLRPANFPTLRLAQFAALCYQSEHLFSQVLESNQLHEMEHLFDVAPSPYWNTHFHFERLAPDQIRMPGRHFVHSLVINTIVPLLFFYGKARGLEEPQNKALAWLASLPAETNTLIDGWKRLGLTAQHAFHSQALIQLKTRYCDVKRCLECAIGNCILK